MLFFIQICHLRYCIHSSWLLRATYESISTLYRCYRNSPDVWWRKQIAELVCVLSVTTAVYTPKQNTWRSAVSVDKCRYRLGASWRNKTVLTNTLLSWLSTLVPRGEPHCFYRQGTLCMTSYCTPALTNRYTRLSTTRCSYSQAESEKFPTCRQ